MIATVAIVDYGRDQFVVEIDLRDGSKKIVCKGSFDDCKEFIYGYIIEDINSYNDFDLAVYQFLKVEGEQGEEK